MSDKERTDGQGQKDATTVETRSGGVPVFELYPEQGKVRILDVVLDVLPLPDPMVRRFIPSAATLKTTCWDTPTATLIRDMALHLKAGIASRNEGPTGVSKSYAAEVLCALTNRPYLRHNYSKDSDPGDTIGRFIPADSKLVVRYEEMLADPTLKQESKDILLKATKESRPLTVYESKRVAALEGISGLEDDRQWRWKNGTLTGSMMWGTVFGADEVNLAPGNVVERENSAIERKPTLRIVENQGEIIRELTPAEKSVIASGGIIPGVISLGLDYWYCAAQNPYGIGGGRFEESEARRNRLQDRIVEALTPTEYEEFLRFLLKGDQPDIVWQGKRYQGEKGLPTQFRDMEKMPNVDVVIKWLASFQNDLAMLTEKGKIGSERDIKGGSYVYTRRNILRFLDSLKGAEHALLDTNELFKSGNLVYNTNWHDLFMEALAQEYLNGMYRADKDAILEIIKASGIEDRLGASSNNPKAPAWVENARKKGLNVEVGQGGWTLSKTDLSGFGIDIETLRQEAVREGYEVSDDGANLSAARPLRSIAELFEEKEAKERPVVTVPAPLSSE